MKLHLKSTLLPIMRVERIIGGAGGKFVYSVPKNFLFSLENLKGRKISYDKAHKTKTSTPADST
jgi:hypothetical protein